MQVHLYDVDGRQRRLTVLKAANLAARGKSVSLVEDKSMRLVEDKTVAELRSEAKTAGVAGTGSMRKQDLIDALEGAK